MTRRPAPARSGSRPGQAGAGVPRRAEGLSRADGLSRAEAKRQARAREGAAFVARPFAGRADEADLVALREVVPSATAPLTLRTPGERSVELATVLPMAWPAMVRRDGAVVLALQTAARSGDAARDLGAALAAALVAPPGTGVTVADLGPPAPDAPRLQDLVTDAPLDITVHPGFDWWLGDAGTGALADDVAANLEQANASVVPTARLTGVSAAYWCRIGDRCHLRWALSQDEEPLLDALARLHVGGGLGVGEGTRFVGSFRAAGILVPVWDLPGDREAAELEADVVALRERLDAALAGGPLTGDERRARAGVVSRQVTLGR